MATRKPSEGKKKQKVSTWDPFLPQFVRTFTEWDHRYRENPNEYWSDIEHLVDNTPQTYGEAAGAYFLKLLLELAD